MKDSIKIEILKALLEEVSRKYDQLLKEKEELLRQTYEKAVRDNTTGLYNRYYLEDFLKRLIRRRRRDKVSFFLVFLDLDGFKKINDNLGHLQGDKILQKVGEFLLNNLRDYDIVARIGGDEFVILSDTVISEHRMEELRRSFEEVFSSYGISFSFGLVSIEDVFEENLSDEEILKKLLLHADAKMYEEKRLRKACR